MNSTILWSALEAISTFLAVLTALFLPFIIKKIDNRSINKLIKFELAENYKNIKEKSTEWKFEGDDTAFPPEVKTFFIQYGKIELTTTKLLFWNKYKARVAQSYMNDYKIYEKLNSHIGNMIKFQKRYMELKNSDGKNQDINIEIFMKNTAYNEVTKEFIKDYENLIKK